MCYSREVSIAFAVFETAAILFIFCRSRRSRNPFVKKQILVLPGLISVCTMEVIEAIVWSRPEELTSILEADSRMCPERNKRLTLFTFMFLLPWQPFHVIFSCRRAGHPRNRELLRVPEMLAIVYAIAQWLAYIYTSLQENPPVRNIRESRYISSMHDQTCMYIGTSGHLHWTLRIADTYLTPNAFTYALLWISVAYARPLSFAAGIFLVALAMFAGQLVYFGLSFETGSVWCWAAIVLSIYFCLQPYLLPLNEETLPVEVAKKSVQATSPAHSLTQEAVCPLLEDDAPPSGCDCDGSYSASCS